jgi:2-polyprenyl-3-methyl-5-hydroxy-6-metoxy-1,4-benzoquinol methylase
VEQEHEAGVGSRAGTRLVNLARRVRYAGYRLLSPLDYLFRRMNQLQRYPPLHLRRQVGGMSAGFNGPGYEFVAYLRLLAGLREGDSLWDVGCGCAMLSVALDDLGWRGRLIGSDVHRPSIEWARKHVESRIAGHRFVHMDIRNAAYWPKGRWSAQEWLRTFEERAFDVVIAKSLFTHVLPDELGVYLRGIRGRLRAGGRALLTFFILSEEQKRLAVQGKNRLSFRPYTEDGSCGVRTLLAPTAAVAYEREFLMECLRQAGFKPEGLRFHPGVWTGRADGLSFQDIVLVQE